MRYLFFLGEYNGYINANKRIALSIAKELIKSGDQVFLMCVNYNNKENTFTKADDFNILVSPANPKINECINDYELLREDNSFVKLLLKKPKLTWNYCKNKKRKFNDLIVNVNQVINRNKIDAIVCFYFPFEPTYQIIKNINSCFKVLYQLDPYGLHENNSKIEKVYKSLKELMIFNKSSLIFTTKVLFDNYKDNFFYRLCLDKMKGMNFPNIHELEVKNDRLISFESKYINVVYLGIIDDDFRNPEKIIDFILATNELLKKKIRLYFIGKNNSKVVSEKMKNNSEFIMCYDPISMEYADYIMNQEGIILLNINNTYKNQIPSKIFNYISSGNPIINVCKRSDDYSMRILDKYNNKYNFIDGMSETDSFINFISSSHNKIDYQSILKNYSDYCPETVTKEFSKQVNKYINLQ